VVLKAQLPEGFDELRLHQEVAIEQTLDCYDNDVDVVFLDAPTGSGKTLIGHQVAAELALRMGAKRALTDPGQFTALYVCSDKALQDQFMRDFPHAKMLKGRANYPTQSNPNATAADCTAVRMNDPCFNCEGGKAECPYEIAKREALAAPLAVINTAYLLSEANYVGGFSGRDLIIADEGDTLEKMMMGFIEYRVPDRLMDEVKMKPPIKGARKKTIVQWLDDFADELDALQSRVSRVRETKRWNSIRYASAAARRASGEIAKDIEINAADDEASGIWLRSYPYNPKGKEIESLNLVPVVVNRHGTKNLWRHGRKWLIMSATIVSADEMADSLGLPLDYETVKVPMTFPVENRPIILAPIANVVYKEMDVAVKDLAYAIAVAVDKHPGERVLVHTVSYKLAQRLEDELRRGEWRISPRNLVTYIEGRGRDEAMAKFMRHGDSVMLAPSMTRGVDMKDDMCRVQIIAKCPFLSLGDKQVSSRMHLPGGQMWYTVNTIREIVQMTGRAVRHEEDWAVTYVFDRQFMQGLWKRWKRLFPAWWAESVDATQDVREFMRPRDSR